MLIRKLTYVLVLIAASIFVFSYYLQKPPYLSFSDAAKFADIARNLVQGVGYHPSFTFFGGGIFGDLAKGMFPLTGISPLMPFSIAGFFKIFGVNDFAVIATSFFYFLFSLLFIYLLTNKVFKSYSLALLSTVSIGFNYDWINYAISGASESPFILEIVAGAYFLSSGRKLFNMIGFIFLILMYFTRPQAFIYITGLILFYLLNRFGAKNGTTLFFGAIVLGTLLDGFILSRFSGSGLLYSVVGRGLQAANQYVPGIAVSNALRGAGSHSVTVQSASLIKSMVLTIGTKVFYNLYNFYKLMPQIMNPYLFSLFVIGMFRWTKDKLYNSLKVATIFMVIITFLVTALSIPFFRYLHPVVPLVYIFAIETLVWIVHKVVGDWCLVASGKLKSQITSHKLLITIVASTFLIFGFGVGQTLGVIFLDSRFERNTHNVGKPPVYVQLSYILKNNTQPNQTVLTNLDTWGSWYGERKTVWYPLTPEQIIPPKGENNSFDVIYLTSYLIDDQNYFMGEEWRKIFENPMIFSTKDCKGCEFIKENYTLKGIYRISAAEDYERQDAKAVLFVKK